MFGSIVRPAELHSLPAEKSAEVECSRDVSSDKAAALPCVAYAVILCGLAVHKRRLPSADLNVQYKQNPPYAFEHTEDFCLTEIRPQLRGVFCMNVCSAFVKGGVICVKVLRVQIVLNDPQSITEALEVRDFPRAQEADRVANIGVVGKAQDVVIGQPRLLLWYDYKCTTDPEPP